MVWLGLRSQNRVRQIYSGVKSVCASFTPAWICQGVLFAYDTWSESEYNFAWTAYGQEFYLSSVYFLTSFSFFSRLRSSLAVPASSPSRAGDVTVYVWHKATELAHSFLFCSCIYFCPYGPFNCTSFHKFSRQLSVFSLFFSGFSLPYWSFQVYVSLWKFPSALIYSLVVDWA